MKKKRKYWYHITRKECVLCWWTVVTRRRIYGRKPKNWTKRCDYIQMACDCHF